MLEQMKRSNYIQGAASKLLVNLTHISANRWDSQLAPDVFDGRGVKIHALRAKPASQQRA
jgi:hypothetical protein